MQTCPTSKKANAGFSLTEVLLVLAVSAGLLVMVAGAGTGFSQSGASRGAISQVASALDHARAHAIARGGYAALVVAGPAAGDQAWRAVAVFAVREDTAAATAGAACPFEVADAIDTPGVEAPQDPVDPVMPWMELPSSQMVFGALNGAGMQSLLDAPDSLKIPWRKGSPDISCKVLVFNDQGSVVYPESKAFRVVRVGRGEISGDNMVLARPEAAAAMPAVSIEKFTGRIRVER